MPCIKIAPNTIACVPHGWGRLHVKSKKKYYWMDFHSYLGPTFYTDEAMMNIYEPKQRDPLWKEFNIWFKKFEKEKEHAKQRAENLRAKNKKLATRQAAVVVDDLREENETLRMEIERLWKDAKRYQWLLRKYSITLLNGQTELRIVKGPRGTGSEGISTYIDTALAAKGE